MEKMTIFLLVVEYGNEGDGLGQEVNQKKSTIKTRQLATILKTKHISLKVFWMHWVVRVVVVLVVVVFESDETVLGSMRELFLEYQHTQNQTAHS